MHFFYRNKNKINEIHFIIGLKKDKYTEDNLSVFYLSHGVNSLLYNFPLKMSLRKKIDEFITNKTNVQS